MLLNLWPFIAFITKTILRIDFPSHLFHLQNLQSLKLGGTNPPVFALFSC